MIKYIKIILYSICFLSIFSSYILYEKNKKLQNKVSITMNNQKILLNNIDSLHTKNRVLQLTTEQLNYYNDSIIEEMNRVKKELKIKDSKVQQMQYLMSVSTKKDTVLFTDTIFKDSSLVLDTVIGDKWYNIRLGLKYPNLIYTEPTFTSEKYIITSKKKETINPPKKFFLLRWFQRKHWVMEVNIVEKNPYIKESNNKFIEIIK